MPITFSCSGCKATLQMADEFAGKKVRCPKCKAIAEVPILAVEVSPAISESAVQPARDPLPAERPEQQRDDAADKRRDRRRDDDVDEHRRPARRSSPPPERKSRALLNRILGGVGVVWGGAIIAYWYLGPKADGAYGTSQIAAMVFGACMFAAGLWYLIIGDRSAPKARPISNSDTDDLPGRPTGSDDRPEPRSGLPRRSSASESVGARSSGRYKTILGILGGSYLLLMILAVVAALLLTQGRRDRFADRGKKGRFDDKKVFFDKKPWFDEKKEFLDKKGEDKKGFDEKKGEDKKGEEKKFFDEKKGPREIVITRLNELGQTIGRLSDDDGHERGRHVRYYRISLERNTTYHFELTSNDFEPLLRVDTLTGFPLGDATGRRGRPAKVTLKNKTPGMVSLVVTTVDPGQAGGFTLLVAKDSNDVEPVTLPPLQAPLSEDPQTQLTSRAIESEGLRVQEVKTSGPMVPSVCWAADGSSFYVLETNGWLRQVSPGDWRVNRQINLGRRASWLAMSSQGLLVTLSDLGEAWLIDPASLNLKKRISAPKALRTVSNPDSDLAYAAQAQDGVVVLDLKKGMAVGTLAMPAALATISPNGQYFFCMGSEQLQRFRIEGTDLIHEESSQRIGQNGQDICVSPDSKLVCLPSGGGNYTSLPEHPETRPYSTYVYAVDHLRKPMFVIESGAYPRTVGFDIVRKRVLAQNRDKQLIVYLGGAKQHESTLGLPQNSGIEGTRQFCMRPRTSELLAVGRSLLWYVHLDGAVKPKTVDMPIPVPKAIEKGKSLLGKMQENGGLKVREIKLPILTRSVRASMAWDAGGENLYVRALTDVLKIRLSDMVLTETTTSNGLALCMSSAGLLTLNLAKNELVVLDPGTLRVKETMTSAGQTSLDSVPAGAHAVSFPSFKDLTVFDLKRKTSARHKIQGSNGKGALSPNGKDFYLLQGATVRRYKLDGSSAPTLDGAFVSPFKICRELFLSPTAPSWPPRL